MLLGLSVLVVLYCTFLHADWFRTRLGSIKTPRQRLTAAGQSITDTINALISHSTVCGMKPTRINLIGMLLVRFEIKAVVSSSIERKRKRAVPDDLGRVSAAAFQEQWEGAFCGKIVHKHPQNDWAIESNLRRPFRSLLLLKRRQNHTDDRGNFLICRRRFRSLITFWSQ